MPIIDERVEPDSIVYPDMFWAYNALTVSDFHHHMIDYSRLFAKHENYNGIENFWNKASGICVSSAALSLDTPTDS